MNFDGWISLEDYCTRYGERRNTVIVRINNGTWERGVIASCPDGGETYIYEPLAKEWLAANPRLSRVRPPEASQDTP